MVTAPTRRYSVDDLAAFPDDGRLRELVDGQIVEWDVPTYRHGHLLLALGAVLLQFARQNGLGEVVGGDAMVRILGSAHDARGPDIAFYRRGRLPQDIDAAATATAPDFVVEIISPSDRADRVLEKVRDWRRAGVQLLWYIDPRSGLTTVYQGGQVRDVAADEALDGGDVLPGLELRLADLLPRRDEEAE